jgi:hypothetical protein
MLVEMEQYRVLVAEFLASCFCFLFLLASLKSLTYSKNPSSNPLQQDCSGFQITTCVILKIVPNAGFDMHVR